MRFDYYAATVPEGGRWAVGALMEAWDSPDWEVRPSRGLHGYTSGAELVDQGNRIAFVWWKEGEDTAHVQASGEVAQLVADQVRQVWPVHRVARADVCEDFQGGRPVWTSLRDTGVLVAQEYGLKAREITDPADEGGGRTLYLGSPSSTLMSRIYEKGLHPEAQAQGIPPDVVRLEYQVRPASRAKAKLAQVQPDDVPGGSKWSAALTSQVLDIEPTRWKAGTIWQPASLEQATSALLAQYGNHLEKLRARHGTPEEVGAELFRQLAKRKAHGL